MNITNTQIDWTKLKEIVYKRFQKEREKKWVKWPLSSIQVGHYYDDRGHHPVIIMTDDDDCRFGCRPDEWMKKRKSYNKLDSQTFISIMFHHSFFFSRKQKVFRKKIIRCSIYFDLENKTSKIIDKLTNQPTDQAITYR